MKPRRLLVASHNEHKIEEIKALTKALNLQVVSLNDLGSYPPIIEDGATFRENAKKKALTIARFAGEMALGDDSGLEVAALKGAPGVHSARYAGEPSSDQKNNAKLLEELKGLPQEKRAAQFRCVMALAFPGGEVKYAEGLCRGQIACEPRGDGGFGYDPLFLIPEYGQTFAELGPAVKNKIGHRGLAARKIVEILERYL
ncbi:MAG TPA: XTP/dITP diphosphatase [Firmicutes bacterium]|nr:XTP/dITP diphosphatase [Bacillota bacterium]